MKIMAKQANTTIKLPDGKYTQNWKGDTERVIRSSLPDSKVELISYTDGSKINKGIGGGVYFHGKSGILSFSLGHYNQYSRQKCMPLRHVQLRI
jgi:hypothetical protein